MHVMGVDADSKKIAAVIFDGEQLETCHFMQSDKKDTQERVFDLYFMFESFLDSAKPDKVYIEEAFYCNNFKTSKAITEVVSNCKLLCRLKQISFELVQNRTWKKHIIGKGNASKEEIKKFVVAQHPEFNEKPQDLSDAFAIGLYGVGRDEKR